MAVGWPFRREAAAAHAGPETPVLRPGNAQHLGSREDQQDSFGFSDPSDDGFVEHGGFAAVLADGMGGLAHGYQASTAAVRAFLVAYAAKAPEESIAAALERAARLANDAVAAIADRSGAAGNMGTTLVAAAVRPGAVEWVSVGDSAIYLYSKRELRRLTSAHNYARELDEQASRGEISVEEALANPDRDALTSYLGSPDIAALDSSTHPVPLEAGDCVLLCSDGLFRTLTAEEIAAELAAEPQQACEALVNKTLARGVPHQDNVTVLCIKADGREPRPVAGAHTARRRP